MPRSPFLLPVRSTLPTAVVLVLLSGCADSAPAQYVEPTLFEFTWVTEPGLEETSGIAVSRRHPGTLWTHNDSGDGPLIYATNLAGENLGSYRISPGEAIDWEDIALGPCPASDQSCLYVGDIGDNREERREIVIYIVPEPAPPPRNSPPSALTAHALRVRYADGAHDAEALAVTREGAILVITKGRRGPVDVYRVPRAQARLDSVIVEPFARLGIVTDRSVGRQVTGAAISPSGAHLVVRTYTELQYYRWVRGQPPAPEGRCWLGIRESQGEAVDFLTEDTLVLTSEAARGRPAMISRVRCPVATERSD